MKLSLVAHKLQHNSTAAEEFVKLQAVRISHKTRCRGGGGAGVAAKYSAARPPAPPTQGEVIS